MNGLEILVCAGVLFIPAAVRAVVFEVRHVGHVRRMIRMTEDEAAEWEDRAAMTVPEHRGSMILAAEQAAHHELPWWPAPTADPEPWRAQMTAELSPEARALDQAEDDAWQAYLLATDDDPGPGDAAVVPPASSGPDQPMWEYRSDHPDRLPERVALPRAEPSLWLAEQLDILRAWSERQQVYAEVLA